MNAAVDTYQMPAHGWTCFHCGETFTSPRTARTHFGEHPGRLPGCLERVQLGEERGLLRALRAAQAEVDRLQLDIEEETTSSRAFHARVESALKSYRPFRQCRSLQDVFNVYDGIEGRALAAEERARLAERLLMRTGVNGEHFQEYAAHYPIPIAEASP